MIRGRMVHNGRKCELVNSFYSTSEDNSYFRVLKRFEFGNESSLSLLMICTCVCYLCCCLSGFQGKSTVHWYQEVNFIFRVVVSVMTQGEEGRLTGIREGIEGDERGEMETGGGDGQMVSSLLARVLTDSLIVAQGTPTQMETEIVKHKQR